MKRNVLNEKWGEDSLSMGWVSFPSSLLFLQKSFQLSPTGLNVLLHLIMHWWEPSEDPYPSQDSIAKRIGVSKRTVQRAMQELEDNKMIERQATSREHPKYRGRNAYSLKPLAKILKSETPELKNKIKFYQ
ncbi:helix-turn-helix domain-containing protein [Shewanella fidelis]|uniref:Helix-turn-helix domain-containing protein n=1 Tax=Shewanella fidelis TaxID=173509 RepID=A0AAW8NXL1_9GAMM|nr:helix-turn-helix domain-containing protein [Shewanella fidelis]MDR8526218.1 helix-turn-helix domain-containing protein [Shewanella fidelis]MDW4814164.1 helix-turn-helix domain-containing protein [Shewanella fidelis]MDW4818308.1 helix-turn-helix domain-containing protein [Shewanella fidelis]MDW4822425.1 helix-turn-helix domain-containing protein [Shewanella fidelis]MDW4826587.1 helix-turn-helix domain-containing protein [Shewanella fidelis]